jgi:hypothetical protein
MSLPPPPAARSVLPKWSGAGRGIVGFNGAAGTIEGGERRALAPASRARRWGWHLRCAGELRDGGRGIARMVFMWLGPDWRGIGWVALGFLAMVILGLVYREIR